MNQENDSTPVQVAHPWHGIAADIDETGMATVFIELVPGQDLKFELDKPSGWLRIDRPQQYASRPPAMYGLLPRTYCGSRVGGRCSEVTGVPDVRGDGDPMDVVLLAEHHPASGGLLARARIVGGLRMVDRGEADDKIIAVLEGDPVYGAFRDIEELPKAVVERLLQYFIFYKQSPGDQQTKVVIHETYNNSEALHMARLSEEDYKEHFSS